MKLPPSRSLAAFASLSFAAIACGNSTVDANDFGEDLVNSSSSSSGSSGPGPLTPQPPAKAGEFESCAAETLKGNVSPVHLVIALDVSGSMCELVEDPSIRDCDANTSKWKQTKQAFSAFFSDPNSQDSYASIITWSGNSCSGFNQPRNPADVKLPDTAGALAASLNGLVPDGGTPTRAAIEGALSYAKSLQSSLTDGGKVVIALATDGEPTACNGISGAAQAATKAFDDGHPVYVIGVGSALTNLNTIAEGAKTNGGKAILVQNDVAANLNKALADIKGKSLGCGMQLPKPAGGKVINPKQINLTYTNKAGATTTLAHSQDCSNLEGWKYMPDASAPTSIELCKNACDTVKVDDKGTIGVVLGCETKDSTK
jgi:hypothetical protein